MRVSSDGSIFLHGREALYLPYARQDASGSQIDISDSVVYFEVEGVLRKQLSPDPNDANGLVIRLTREEVDQLPDSPTAYVTIDETDPLRPWVERSASILRIGWVEEPQNG